MGRRRGFFAELQHQQAVNDRNRQRAQAASVREYTRIQRESERANAASLRAHAQAVKAGVRATAEQEKEAKRLFLASQEATVEALNAALELHLSEIDDLLTATLAVDDYVELEGLRAQAEHPPFTSTHDQPTPAYPPLEAPPEPVFHAPEAPKGVSALFGKKKHAEQLAHAQRLFSDEHARWSQAVAAIPMKQLQQLSEHKKAEDTRLGALAQDQATYDGECHEREAAAADANAKLDALIRDFDAGAGGAVEEYIGIVLGNSVYPTDFPWDLDYQYDPDTLELRINLQFPRPDQLPTTRHYKYVRARDEITETAQTQKEQRDRYTKVVHNMTLRTLHEVWESDRTGKIKSISLAGGVQHIDPAVGTETFTPLIALAAERESFLEIDLAYVLPAETLRHLHAVVSKNPHSLIPIDTSQGIRGH